MPAPDLPSVLCFQEFSCSLAVLCRPEPCRNVVSLGGQPRFSSYQKWTKSGGTSPILSMPDVRCNPCARSSLRHLDLHLGNLSEHVPCLYLWRTHS